MNNDEELQLHHLLLSGDQRARSQACWRYLGPLTQRLQKYNPRIDSSIVEEAAIDAMLDYIDRPASYNPALKPIASYLLMSASGDLKNKLRAEQRHRDHQVSLSENVGFAPAMGNSYTDDNLLERITTSNLQADIIAVAKDDQERAVLDLMMQGVREYQPYAELLDVQQLPPLQQREAVNKAKERLRVRVKRKFGNSGRQR
jgi:hypothetical protein